MDVVMVNHVCLWGWGERKIHRVQTVTVLGWCDSAYTFFFSKLYFMSFENKKLLLNCVLHKYQVVHFTIIR